MGRQRKFLSNMSRKVSDSQITEGNILYSNDGTLLYSLTTIKKLSTGRCQSALRYRVSYMLRYHIQWCRSRGGWGYISPQYFRFLQILGRKCSLKAKKPIKNQKIHENFEFRAKLRLIHKFFVLIKPL